MNKDLNIQAATEQAKTLAEAGCKHIITLSGEGRMDGYVLPEDKLALSMAPLFMARAIAQSQGMPRPVFDALVAATNNMCDKADAKYQAAKGGGDKSTDDKLIDAAANITRLHSPRRDH